MDAEELLIQRARGGDPAAFREVFLRHRREVARIVHRVMGNSPDVEDVVQDVFVHVYRSLASFRGESKFTTWLYRLTINVTRMHLRRGRSRPQIADVQVPEGKREESPMDSPEQSAMCSERLSALYRLLDTLGEKKRTVLVLHDIEGMPAKEIAEIVGAPVLTVRTRLFYARKELYAAIAKEPKLRALLDDLGPDVHGKPDTAAATASGPGESGERISREPPSP